MQCSVIIPRYLTAVPVVFSYYLFLDSVIPDPFEYYMFYFAISLITQKVSTSHNFK